MTYQYIAAGNPRWQSFQDFVTSPSPNIYQFIVNPVTSIITCNVDPKYFTTFPVSLSTNNTLPSPLSQNVTYYIILVAPNQYRLATSYSNAMLGIYITITDTGTGIQSINAQGQSYLIPLAYGYIESYSSQDHTAQKAAYRDDAGMVPYPDPIPLDNNGQALIYWQVNLSDPTDNYYLEIYNAIGVLMNIVDNFNGAYPSGITPGDIGQVSINHFRNNCFTYSDMYSWYAEGQDYGTPVAMNVSVLPVSREVEIVNEVFFSKSNDNATDIITILPFNAGQTLVDPVNNSIIPAPPFYMQYQCESAGAGGETYKYISQKYDNVQTFNGEPITFYIFSESTAPANIYIDAYQFFGAGGSASVDVPGIPLVVGDNFSAAPVTLNIPSTSGKNIKNGSYLQLRINVPVNSTFTISLAAAQLTQTLTGQPFIQLTLEEQKNTLTTTGDTGDVKTIYDISRIPRTWFSMTDGTIGNVSSNASVLAANNTFSLFCMLWAQYDDFACRIYTSAGVRTTRGTDAPSDFNANKQLGLPFTQGRAVANVGNPTFLMDFTATDFTTWVIDVGVTTQDQTVAGQNLFDGTPVQLLTTNGLPTATPALTTGTTYYIITWALGQFQLAASLADALAGTAIHITAAAPSGSIMTLQSQIVAPQYAGTPTGESAHTQYRTEVGVHNHSTLCDQASTPGGVTNFTFPNNSASFNPNTSNTPTPTPMNIIQPTTAIPFIMKL